MNTLAESANAALPISYGMQLSSVVRLLRHNLLLIGLLAAVGVVAAYAYARTFPKHYTASSLIAVEGDRFTIPELEGALRSAGSSDPLPVVRTEMQALTSRDLVLEVMDQLKLSELPEFNSDLRPPTLVQQAKAAFQSLLPSSSETPRAAADPREGVLGAVVRQIKIFQDNRSLAIEVSFTSEDPKLSSDVVNKLISRYVSSRAQHRIEVNRGANEAISQRADQVRSDLDSIERQMQDLRNSNEMVLLRAGSVGQQQLEELATAAARASVERAQIETTFVRASALAKQGSSDELANVLGSGTVSSLRAQESAVAQRAAQMSTQYGSDYPGVRSAQAELGSVRRQLSGETQRIVASLGAQLNVAKAHEADVQRQLDDARKAAVKGEDARAKLEQFEQEVKTQRALYQTLLERAQQTFNQPTGAETPDVRVISTAAPPVSPSSPNMKIAAGLGGVAGALFGSIVVLARSRQFDRFTSPADLTAATGLSVISALPSRRFRRGIADLAGQVVTDAHGAEAEAMRDLRSRLRRLGRSSSPRIVTFCSAQGGAAALQVASGLARVAAADGERVLLIEADLQNPAVSKLMQCPAGDLLSVLKGRDWRDATGKDDRTPLRILSTSGPSRGERTLLSGSRFQNLLIETRNELDLVVLVAPAAGSPDAQVLSQRSDVTLVVIKTASKRVASQAMVDRLNGGSSSPVVAVTF